MNAEEANNLLIDDFTKQFQTNILDKYGYTLENMDSKLLDDISLDILKLDGQDLLFQLIPTIHSDIYNYIILWSLLDPKRYKRLLLSDKIKRSHNELESTVIFTGMTFVPPIESIHLILDGGRFYNPAFLIRLLSSSYLTDDTDILHWITNTFPIDSVIDEILEQTQDHEFADIIRSTYEDVENGTRNSVNLAPHRVMYPTHDPNVTYKLFMNIVNKYNITITNDDIKTLMHDRGDYNGEVENAFYNIYHDLKKYDYSKLSGTDLSNTLFPRTNYDEFGSNRGSLCIYFTRTPTDMKLSDLLMLKLLSKLP